MQTAQSNHPDTLRWLTSLSLRDKEVKNINPVSPYTFGQRY